LGTRRAEIFDDLMSRDLRVVNGVEAMFERVLHRRHKMIN
jgi:hypothetical protein